MKSKVLSTMTRMIGVFIDSADISEFEDDSSLSEEGDGSDYGDK